MTHLIERSQLFGASVIVVVQRIVGIVEEAIARLLSVGDHQVRIVRVCGWKITAFNNESKKKMIQNQLYSQQYIG